MAVALAGGKGLKSADQGKVTPIEVIFHRPVA
jgi:hypothetical protein